MALTVQQAQEASAGLLALKEIRAHKARPAHLVSPAKMVWTVVVMVSLDATANPDFPEKMVETVVMDGMEPMDLEDTKETRVTPVTKDFQAFRDFVAPKETRATSVREVLADRKVCKALVASLAEMESMASR